MSNLTINTWQDTSQILLELPDGSFKYTPTCNFINQINSGLYMNTFNLPEDSCICIKTSNTIINDIKQFDNEMMFDYCSILVNDIKKRKNNNVWVLFCNKNQKTEFTLPICNVNGEFLFSYHYSICKLSENFSEIFNPIIKLLGLSSNDVFIANLFGKIENGEISEFYESLINRHVFIVSQLTKQNEELIQTRISLLNEFWINEKIYYEQIEIIKKYVLKFFNENNIIDEVLKTEFEIIISTIEIIHKSILEILYQGKNNFLFTYGDSFLSQTEFIDIYKQYIAIYKKIIPKFMDFYTDALNIEILNNIEKSSYLKNYPISVLLINVFQRPIIYLGNIDNLLKVTPKQHEDYELLLIVKNKFEDFNNQIHD